MLGLIEGGKIVFAGVYQIRSFKCVAAVLHSFLFLLQHKPEVDGKKRWVFERGFIRNKEKIEIGILVITLIKRVKYEQNLPNN